MDGAIVVISQRLCVKSAVIACFVIQIVLMSVATVIHVPAVTISVSPVKDVWAVEILTSFALTAARFVTTAWKTEASVRTADTACIASMAETAGRVGTAWCVGIAHRKTSAPTVRNVCHVTEIFASLVDCVTRVCWCAPTV